MKTKILTTGIFLSLLIPGLTGIQKYDNHENKSTFSIKQIANGTDFSAAVTTEDGFDHLYMWGDNGEGQIGQGSDPAQFYNSPKEVDINNNGIFGDEGEIQSVSLGDGFSSVVTLDSDNNNHLYMWGDNTHGQLGLGVTGGEYSTPQEIVSPNDSNDFLRIEQVELGSNFSAVITSYGDSKLYMWGDNTYGQLGLGDTNERNKPEQVTFEKAENEMTVEEVFPTTISLGKDHVLMSLESYGYDYLLTWGNNDKGQLGLGTEVTEVFEPTYIKIENDGNSADGGNITNISAGDSFSSITSIGEYEEDEILYTWGDNRNGQLGLGSNSSSFWEPTPVSLVDKEILNVSLGGNHSAAITQDNNSKKHLYTWGSNEFGQLGIGSNSTGLKSSPQLVSFFEIPGEISKISLGREHSSAIFIDSSSIQHLYTWGSDERSQLGLGYDFTDEMSNSPLEITKVSKRPPVPPEIISVTVEASSIKQTTATLDYQIETPSSTWETKSTLITKIKVYNRDNNSVVYASMESKPGYGLDFIGSIELSNLTVNNPYQNGELIFEITWNNEDPLLDSTLTYEVPGFSTIDWAVALPPSFLTATTLYEDASGEAFGINYNIDEPNNGVNDPTLISKIEITDNNGILYGQKVADEGYSLPTQDTILFENINGGTHFNEGDLFLKVYWNKDEEGATQIFNEDGSESFGDVPEFKTLNPALAPHILSTEITNIKDNKAQIHYKLEVPRYGADNRDTVISNISVKDLSGETYGSIDNSKEVIPDEGDIKIKLKPSHTYKDLFVTLIWNDEQIVNADGSLPPAQIKEFTTKFSSTIIFVSVALILLTIIIIISSLIISAKIHKNKRTSRYHLSRRK